MKIPEYSRKFFTISETDDKYTAMLKQYYLDNDRVSRELEAKQQAEFHKKYTDIHKQGQKNAKEITELKKENTDLKKEIKGFKSSLNKEFAKFKKK